MAPRTPGEACLRFSLNSSKKPSVFKDIVSPLFSQVKGLFSLHRHGRLWLSGMLILLHSLHFPLHTPQNGNYSEFIFRSKTVHLYICDQIYVFNFLSDSRHSTMSHSTVGGTVGRTVNPAMPLGWQGLLPSGHIQFLLWRLIHSPQTPDKAEVSSISLHTCSTVEQS